jgi:hypothetical protein
MKEKICLCFTAIVFISCRKICCFLLTLVAVVESQNKFLRNGKAQTKTITIVLRNTKLTLNVCPLLIFVKFCNSLLH